MYDSEEILKKYIFFHNMHSEEDSNDSSYFHLFFKIICL